MIQILWKLVFATGYKEVKQYVTFYLTDLIKIYLIISCFTVTKKSHKCEIYSFQIHSKQIHILFN